MPDWQAMFDVSVPILENVVRGTVMYFVVLALMRITGQREAGGLSITDILLVVLVAEAAAPGLHGDSKSLADAIIMVSTILGWSIIIDAIAYRSPKLSRIIKSRPRPLIEDGELNRKVMRRELMTEPELMSQLRLHGVYEIRQVKRAFIEPNGMISVLKNENGDSEAPDRPPSVI